MITGRKPLPLRRVYQHVKRAQLGLGYMGDPDRSRAASHALDAAIRHLGEARKHLLLAVEEEEKRQ